MAKTSEEFLKKFDSLEGLTVAQRQKNFFKLLHESAPYLQVNTDLLTNISTNLTPKTYLETLFRVDFLIYFRRTQELFQILKEGNDILVSKIVKQIWFFQEFGDIPPDQIVTEILPCLSYSVRMKVLGKLSRYSSDEKFGGIFDRLVGRYGIYLATRFITGCKPDKIRQVLNLYPLKLTSTQLRILHGKDRNLIDFYFARPENNLKHDSYKYFVKFLLDNDRLLFDALQEKHKLSIKLGRRATKKFVDLKRNEIIETPYKFDYIDMKAVIRKIGRDSVKLFTNALPTEIQNCIDLNKVIRSFPKRYHYNLFVKIFPAHYEIKLEDHHYLINRSLLNLITDEGERARLAKIRVDRGDDEYIVYLGVDESIPLIKEQINLTSDISERGELIKKLIQTCHINKDLNALFSVMQYFNFRHKNDELIIHLNFIRNIENLFGFKQFTEDMWNCLNELLAIHMLKFDHRDSTNEKIQTLPLLSINLGISTGQKLAYLEFLFKKGDPIDDLLVDYFSDSNEFPVYGQYDKNFEKHLLQFAINNLKTDKELNCGLFAEIAKWNQLYKDDQLNFYDYPVLVDTFIKVVKKEKRFYFASVLQNFRAKIFTASENEYRKQYLEIYWEYPTRYLTVSDIRWFLNFDPLTIFDNFDIVLNYYTKRNFGASQLRDWLFIKKYSHLNLEEKTILKWLEKLNDETCLDKQKFIPFLSVLMKPQDFVNIANFYKPENKKLDLNNEKQVRLYNLQCAIAMHFKNTKNHEGLSSLLFYCAGDYFKYAMRSLYSLLYRTPENLLPKYLNFLSEKAVSVRKHALFLTCELSTSKEVENIIIVLNRQEGVVSLQKHLFAATIQYFVKNPTEEFLELVKMNMSSVSKTDEESLRSIINHLEKIPKQFKASYIVHAWEHIEKTVEIWGKLRPLKKGLLDQMSLEICKEIPLEFGLEIIDKHFWLQDNIKDLHTISDFDFNFLRARTQKDIIFEKIFAKVDLRTDVFYFLQNWYRKIMMLKNVDVSYFELFVHYYEQHVSFIDDFDYYIQLFLLKTKLKYFGNVPIDGFVVDFLPFFDGIVEKCGIFVISLFGKIIEREINYLFKEKIHEIQLYYEIIKRRPEPNIAMLLMPLLPVKQSSFYERQMRYRQLIINAISKIDDIGVQIYLKNGYKHDLGENKRRQ